MSIINFPRTFRTPTTTTGTRRPRTTTPTSTRTVRTPVTRRGMPRAYRASIVVMAVALGIMTFSMLFDGQRQVDLYNLQTTLQNDQSAYAIQLSSFSALSAPGAVATHAQTLHLVEPTTVSQVPSTSLDATLPLPTFSGYAPVTPRTQR